MKKDLNSVSNDLTRLFTSSELFLIEDALTVFFGLHPANNLLDVLTAFHRAARWEKHFNKTDRDI